jgi:Cu(I)/Ag(I) efflux system periplasmic protein CusF
MKIQTALASAALALASVISSSAFAQHKMEHNKVEVVAKPGMTDGEVRKIDKEAGKITIKHGEIKHMDMPPMTMVFVVKDKALFDKTAVGAKILFMAAHENGQMIVTEIQTAK